MRPYEVMIILDPNLDDEGVRAAVDRSTALVGANGGTVGRVDRWGKRRLAYEIRHQREGYYVLMEASSPHEAMSELHRALQLADEVLRHKVIRLPDGAAGRARRPVTIPGPGVAAEQAATTS